METQFDILNSHTPLTAREQEVFTLLIHGLTYREMSAELGIGFNTVHTHLVRIYKKLGVRSRSQAVARLLALPGPTRPAKSPRSTSSRAR